MSKASALFQLTRPLNCLIAGLSIFMGGFVTGTIQPLEKLLFASISGMLIAGGANSINDLFDVEIDRINKPGRPLPRGALSIREADFFSWTLSGAGIALGVFVGIDGFILALTSVFFLFWYSHTLKRTALWGNLAVALVTGLAFLYGGMAVDRWKQASVVAVFAFLYHLAREIIKDIEDMEGDSRAGIQTFPIRYGTAAGLKLSTWIIAILMVMTVLPYLFHVFSLRYLVTVVIGVDAFLAGVVVSMWRNQDHRHLGRLAYLMKLDMFIGLIAVYLGK